jgi:hypothetical protein
LAASFQVVLVIGHSDRITPINVAEALNVNCPRCITTAIAKQLVISLKSAPSDDLLERLTAELRRLDAIDPSDSPADVLKEINSISDAIQQQLDDSGLAYPEEDETAEPDETEPPSSPTVTATPDEPAATPTATATAVATTTVTAEPTAEETPAPEETSAPSSTPAAFGTAEPATTP